MLPLIQSSNILLSLMFFVVDPAFCAPDAIDGQMRAISSKSTIILPSDCGSESVVSVNLSKEQEAVSKPDNSSSQWGLPKTRFGKDVKEPGPVCFSAHRDQFGNMIKPVYAKDQNDYLLKNSVEAKHYEPYKKYPSE